METRRGFLALLSSLLAPLLLTVPALAQAPGWSRGQQDLAISYEECVRRAASALTAEGFRIDYSAGAFSVGIREVHTAVISCGPAPSSRTLVNIVVASNGEGGGTWRERLQAQMDRTISSSGGYPPPITGGGSGTQPPATGGSPAPARPGSYITVTVRARQAALDWANAPTNAGSWVSIVPAGTPDGQNVGRWIYTDGKPAGRYENGPLPVGAYEARFYGDGGYGQIVDRVRFDVVDDAPASGQGQLLRIQLGSTRAALVTWTNAPTTDGAWVSVVPIGTPDNTHTGMWQYTNQTASGSYQTAPLNAGEYEARFYGDGQYGRLIERVRFRVP